MIECKEEYNNYEFNRLYSVLHGSLSFSHNLFLFPSAINLTSDRQYKWPHSSPVLSPPHNSLHLSLQRVNCFPSCPILPVHRRAPFRGSNLTPFTSSNYIPPQFLIPSLNSSFALPFTIKHFNDKKISWQNNLYVLSTMSYSWCFYSSSLSWDIVFQNVNFVKIE